VGSPPLQFQPGLAEFSRTTCWLFVLRRLHWIAGWFWFGLLCDFYWDLLQFIGRRRAFSDPRGAGIFFDSHILQIPFSGQPLRVFNKLHGSEALLLLVEPRLKIHSIVGEMRTWLGILISFRGAFKGYSHFSDDWVIFSNSIFTLSMFAYNLCFIEHVRSMAVAVGGDLWAFLDSLGWARCCIGLTFKHTKLWYFASWLTRKIGNRPLH